MLPLMPLSLLMMLPPFSLFAIRASAIDVLFSYYLLMLPPLPPHCRYADGDFAAADCPLRYADVIFATLTLVFAATFAADAVLFF